MNHRGNGRGLIARWTVTALLAGAVPAWAGQPADQPGGPPEGERGPRAGGPRPPGPDRGVVRERLVRRQGDLRRLLERIEAAIAQLDAGGNVGEIMRGVMEEPDRGFEPGRGPRPEGPRGPDGPRGDGPRPEGPPGGGPGGVREGPDRPRPPGEFGPIRPEERQRLMEFFAEHFPRLAERARTADRENAPGAERFRDQLLQRLRELRHLKEHDAPMFERRGREFRADLLLNDAIQQVRRALHARPRNEDEVRRAEESLNEAMMEMLDARAAVQEREIEDLAARLERLRASAREQAENRAAVARERVEQIRRRVEGEREARPARP